jgi:hypothetical protein
MGDPNQIFGGGDCDTLGAFLDRAATQRIQLGVPVRRRGHA